MRDLAIAIVAVLVVIEIAFPIVPAAAMATVRRGPLRGGGSGAIAGSSVGAEELLGTGALARRLRVALLLTTVSRVRRLQTQQQGHPQHCGARELFHTDNSLQFVSRE
jgi:hypothetical protein